MEEKKYLEDFYAKEGEDKEEYLKKFWADLTESIKHLSTDELSRVDNMVLQEKIRRYALQDRDKEVKRLIMLADSFDEFVRFCSVSSVQCVNHFPVEELQDMWQEFMDGKAGDNEQ